MRRALGGLVSVLTVLVAAAPRTTILSSGFRSLVVCAALLLALSRIAAADQLVKPKNAEARAHLEMGNKLYRLREFGKAVEEYKAGMLAEDLPVFAYNLAQSYRQLGHYEEAIWHYERFLHRASPPAEMRTAIEGFLAQMKSELEKKATNEQQAKAAPVAVSSTPPIEAKPAPEIASASTDGGRGISSRRKLAIAIGGGGLAAIAAGTVLGVRANSFEHDADELCPATSCESADEANALVDRGKTNARYANVMFGVGGGLIVGAVVLWVTGIPRSSTTAIAPHVSNSFAGLSLASSF